MEIENLRNRVAEALEIKMRGSRKYGLILYKIIKSLKDTGVSYSTIANKINAVIPDDKNKYSEDSLKKIYYWYSNKNIPLKKESVTEIEKGVNKKIVLIKDEVIESSDLSSLIEDENQKYERENNDLFKGW